MVNLVILNPDGDCSDASLPLKGKDLEKDVFAILKKRISDPSAPKQTNTRTKTIPLINSVIKNLGETSVYKNKINYIN